MAELSKHHRFVPFATTVSGLGLSLSFVIATHYFAGDHQLEIFALFLALTSCVYGGAILTPLASKYTFVEIPFVMIVFVAAVLGLLFHPLWLAAGYAVHGVWDGLHHFKKVQTPIVNWFPPMCAVFDMSISLFIIWVWYSSI
jgi:hypothetical protein